MDSLFPVIQSDLGTVLEYTMRLIGSYRVVVGMTMMMRENTERSKANVKRLAKKVDLLEGLSRENVELVDKFQLKMRTKMRESKMAIEERREQIYQKMRSSTSRSLYVPGSDSK